MYQRIAEGNLTREQITKTTDCEEAVFTAMAYNFFSPENPIKEEELCACSESSKRLVP
ncbi:hypothetical protein LEAN103870_18720 [Legionella anisa]|nr:hypothetical protein [Legionella anisa]KTC74409.1 hypothetical protein Lani_0770 [Legionella anisa]MCW8425785.1 hypothetical protein [Legionella anisa]